MFLFKRPPPKPVQINVSIILYCKFASVLHLVRIKAILQ